MSIDGTERERRRRLVQAHMRVENAHDLDGIIGTFSDDGVMLYNRQAFEGPDPIRAAHAYFGLSATPGAFEGLHVVPDHEHFTEHEIVIEGRMCGRHVAEFEGFPPTGRDVEMPYVAFYRFDERGQLVSERVVMDLAVLRADV
jgi:hypothetical protein